MEKKYYDLIIKLIKEHRKYSGLEAILEDIANDVYEHSKVVIGSITNDEVITAYLNKVVATSIVTVPKKMNFNVKTRHRIITTIIPQATEVVAPTPAVVEEQVQPEVSAKVEEVLFVEEVITPEVVKEPEQEAVTLEEMTEVIEEELPVPAVDSISEPELEPEPVTSPATQVDKNLVDLMINGVPSQDSEEDILVEETLEEESSEIYESLELVEPSEEDSLEQQDDVSSEGNFEVPTFSCFSYEPEKPDYDSAEILSYLIEIDEKHPERKILTICDMKYNQGLSVTEIAKTVGFTEENVIEVLNEIIDTIKD